MAASVPSWGQSGSQTIGEITAIDSQARLMTLRTDKGESITVAVAETAVVRKVPPGATDMSAAVRIAFGDLGKSDRIAAIGTKPDGGRMDARSIVVMTRSELAQKQQQEREDWQKRGIAGLVASVDAKAGTLAVRSGGKVIAVQPSAATSYFRYAPESVRFSEATASALDAIKPGDQIRVLGNKSADGASIQAERVVFGSFRQLAATITAIKPEAGEMTVKDLDTKKTIVVRVNSDSTMRKLPPPMAASLAKRYQPGGAAPAAGDAPDVGQMLDRLPALPLADLKAGDAIMLSCTSGSDASRVTAIMLLAGVEPLLTASPNATRDIMGGWNLSAGGTPSQ